jgi:hypothetical protein
MIWRQIYEELGQVFYHFLKYLMKILLGDFNAKMEREDIFRPTIGNDSYIRIVMTFVLE